MRRILVNFLSMFLFSLMFLVASSGVGFGAQQPVGGQPHDLPGRIIALAYLVAQDPVDFEENFPNKSGNEYLKAPFKRIFQMFPHGKEGFPNGHEGDFELAGTLGSISHYCIVQLTSGFFCGDREFPENSQGGYLFVSDWITGHGKPYILMIVGSVSPGQTSIVRIMDGEADVLYDSFSRKNKCGFVPSVLNWNDIATTHYVKVITPTTFKIVTGGYQMESALAAATLKLSVDGINCKLTVLSKKTELP